jgi:hypothetical protein
VCVCPRCLVFVFLASLPPFKCPVVSVSPPTPLLPDGLGKGCALPAVLDARASWVRQRRGSEAIGRRALGKGLNGPWGGGGATKGWSRPGLSRPGQPPP